MLVVTDTETTGFTNNHILELASVILMDNGEQHEWYEMAWPSSEIEQEASDTHGITFDNLKGCRKDTEVVAEWWDDLCRLSQEHDCEPIIIACHNAYYDLKALRKYVEIPLDFNNVCTMRLGRLYNPESLNHKLVELHSYLGLKGDYKAHSAMDDVYMCLNILNHYCNIKKVNYMTLAKRLKNPISLATMPFGKHKDSPMSVVPGNYMNYLLGFNDLDPDVAYSFRLELERRRLA